MPHHSHGFNRAQLAAEANRRAQIPDKAVTLVWRAKGATKTTSVSFVAGGALAVGALALSVWGVAVTSYLAFRDDIVGGLMTRHATMQTAYEDRIRELRTEVDRLTSRQMVDQTETERRLEQVVRRQAMLETRQSIVASLNETSGMARPTRAAGDPAPSPAPPARPLPVGDTLRLSPPLERHSRLESRPDPAAETRLASALGAAGAAGGRLERIAGVERSLDRLEARQQHLLQALETQADRRARRIRGVLAELGLDQGRLAHAPHQRGAGGTGGPLIPIPEPVGNASPFERQVFRLQGVMRDFERLNQLASTVPLGRPHEGDFELSSSFGPRLDPFLRTWAMHSGIDFRGATGDPVYATAAGRVSHAGSMGGYGLMVEIDHGNGLATRYAHLSRIEVAQGDEVRAGRRVGRIGTTGRSTGPHLHYETRINGEAVDPMRFVRAGLRLAAGEDRRLASSR